MAIDIGDDALLEATTVGSGTGNYDSFLRLQATNVEEGFNTDENGNVLDNKASFTHSLQYGDLVPITVDGVEYIEFRLDLNESNSSENGQITLTDLNIYLSGSEATLADYTAGFAGFDTVYSLDTSHLLIDANHGSGTDDYRVLIPVSSFTDAGVTADSYVTLFSGFSGSNGGFEEWRTTTTSGTGADTAAIVVEKTADPTSINEGVATQVTYTYEVINTSPAGAADPLTLISLVDDNATPGSPGDDINLLDGFVASSSHGTHYVSGDTDNDYLVDSNETWTFNATVNVAAQDAGSSIVNTVVVHAHDDDSLNDVTANDTATVTVNDVAPSIAVDKTADPISIDEGASGDVTYTYKVTNTSAAGAFDPLTLTSLVDDNATPGSPGDDINLLDGFVANSTHGTHYVTGDIDNDYLVDSDETWTFNATVNIAAHNAGSSIVNTVVVHGHDDDSLTDVTANDTATVTVNDVAPAIAIEKTADTISIDEGASGDVTYTYKVTNTSPAGALDPLTLTSLVDDNATPGSPGDDVNLLDGFVANSTHGTHYVSGDTDNDYLVDSDETWTFNATVNIAAHNAGSIVNTVVVHGHDDDSLTDVTANDTATVTVNDVAPAIAVEKTADPISINEGVAGDVTYTYKVTNTSPAGAFDPLTLTSLVDDNATPGSPGDDINLLDGFVANSTHGTHYVTGDTDNDYLVDSDETWTFNATVNIAAHNAGSIVNTVVVHGHDDDSLTDVTANDTATVTVKDVAPSIAIDKTVDADHDGIFHSSETVQSGAQNATYHYAITNTSPAGALDPLTLTSLVDDNGTANTGDDINLLSGFVANSSHGTHYVSGDADGDYQVDSNETWVFEATSAFNLAPNAASRTNTVEVAAHDDDSLNEVSAQDTATVSSFAGPGVRTPGFWSNLGKSFWDGVDGVGKTGPNFATKELLYQVDSNNDGNKNGSDKAGLLIGDYNKNGTTDAGEDTFFISYADALKVIDASSKDLQDTRFVLARDAVATWLNFLAGNPIGDASNDPNSPQKYLDQAIDWLQVTNGGTSSSHFEDWGGGSAVKASTAAWNVGLDAESVTGGSELAGNLIHQELDFYNNTGMTFEGAILHIYANDGG